MANQPLLTRLACDPVENSSRQGHHKITYGGRVIAEVTGETYQILAVEACTLLDTLQLIRHGLNRQEEKDSYKRLRDKIQEYRSAIAKDAEEKKALLDKAKEIEDDYLNNSKRVTINFGAQKALCIMQALAPSKMK